MTIYILVANNDGEPTLNMPYSFGRNIRAYESKARAKVYARRFKCAVVEIDLEDGQIIFDETDYEKSSTN